MRAAFRYVVTAVIGAALGIAAAAYTVRAGALGSDVNIGPWSTGRDLGTADASARTRAIVALKGLLALPAREARYYTATTDDAGRPLDGRCRYRVDGSALPARWWSLTLYDSDGYLVANRQGRFSVESATVQKTDGLPWNAHGEVVDADYRSARSDPNAFVHWAIEVSPAPENGPNAIPTAGLHRFQLTLRLYLPNDDGRGDPPRGVLPSIIKEGC